MRRGVRLPTAVTTVLAFVIGVAPVSAAQDYEKLAPYSGIRWKATTPEVELDGEWHELRAIDDIPVVKIVEFCKRTYAHKWQKRFDEDVVQVLSEMGHPPGKTVTLLLREANGGAEWTVPDAAMTEAKRHAIWQVNYAKSGARNRPPVRPAHLSAQQTREDLAHLRMLLETRYSYLERKGLDFRTAIAALGSKLGAKVAVDDFTIEIQKLLAGFGDGHTRVAGWRDALPRGYTPFLIGESNGRLVAFKEDRSGFLGEGYPYLVAIDGIPVDKWLEAARQIVAKGSAQSVRGHAIRNMRYLVYLRQELGRRSSNKLVVRLASEDRTKTLTLEFSVADQRPIYGEWPRSRHSVLAGNVGYLRIPSMDDDSSLLHDLVAAMSRFRKTEGLIIDVRGNGGGSRAALRTLFPFFIAPADPSFVANIAAYRLEAGDDPNRKEGYLHNRWLYPQNSSVWNQAERKAIQPVARTFAPEWKLPSGAFSAWHYFVLSRTDSSPYYQYDQPVVVLLDENCFSATDIFLGAFKGRPNVTLMGTPSGGGSGRSRRYRLPNSGISFRMSSMASFRPDGTLYDGRGIQPDVIVARKPRDLIASTDSALQAALAYLSGNPLGD